MWEDINQEETILASAISFNVTETKMTMIIDFGKLLRLLWTITCESLKFYAKLEEKDLVHLFKNYLVPIIWQVVCQSPETSR